MMQAQPVGDKGTYDALQLLMQGIPNEGTANVPMKRAQAFLKAMGTVSPSNQLLRQAESLAARYSPYSFVGSGADKASEIGALNYPFFQLPPFAGK